jgi:hypothetical protein
MRFQGARVSQHTARRFNDVASDTKQGGLQDRRKNASHGLRKIPDFQSLFAEQTQFSVCVQLLESDVACEMRD